MATYPLATLAAQVTSTGISAPSYNDILSSLTASFQGIYGSDAYLAPDSQDGQLLAVVAQAIYDCNQTAIAVYNQFSPQTAQGAGLSSVVKINGLNRLVPTNSTAVGNVVGTAGTTITNGVVKDINGNLWNLPASVTIPTGGSIAVTVTAQSAGAINAAIGDINTINTPTRGWQSFSNTSAATPGNPTESDATLRARQTVSTALPSQAIVDGIAAALGNVTGIEQYRVYENPTSTTDSNGAPAHCIYPVVYGGNVTDIAAAINVKKPPGTVTYGTTSVSVTNATGLPVSINFYEATVVTVPVAITIKALTGYVSTTGDAIIAAIVAYINALGIGGGLSNSVEQTGIIAAAKNIAFGTTFNITSVAITGGSPDLAIAFNDLPMCATANVTLTVT